MNDEFAFVNEKRMIEEINGVQYETVYTAYRSIIDPTINKIVKVTGEYLANHRIETPNPNYPNDVVIPEYVSPEQNPNVIDSTQIGSGRVIVINPDTGIVGDGRVSQDEQLTVDENIRRIISERVKEEIVPENLNSYWSKI